MMSALGMLGAGVLLGALYFGGLWLTVRVAVRRRASGVLHISQGVRLVGLGAALVLIGATRPGTLLPALLGLIAARVALTTALGSTSHAA